MTHEPPRPPSPPAPYAGVVTIDGPAGTGKSVTARALAERAGLTCLDSGAVYRALAWAAERDGIDLADGGLQEWLEHLPLALDLSGPESVVVLGGTPLGEELRAERIGQTASLLAMRPDVRDRVARLLREAARGRGCVAEGRDMGSAVFPAAALKLFLTASPEARGTRRIEQLRHAGASIDEERVRNDLRERDLRDESRAVSPLRKPSGAILIDTSDLDLAEQIDLVVELWQGGGRLRGTPFYRLVHATSRALFTGLLGAEVDGLENLPTGAFIVASNHRAAADPFLVASAVPGAPGILAKEELFHGLLGAFLRQLETIPVRRGMADRRALRTALTALRRGRPLLIFPEGTRVRGGELGQPHAGVAWLARQADVPVVPARIAGPGFGTSLLRRRRVRLSFGQPLLCATDGYGAAGDTAFARRVMAAIAALGPGA